MRVDNLCVCVSGAPVSVLATCNNISLSIALTGTEQCMCHLRLLTAYSLITHRDHMVEVMKPTAQVLLPQSERNAASIAKKAENE